MLKNSSSTRPDRAGWRTYREYPALVATRDGTSPPTRAGQIAKHLDAVSAPTATPDTQTQVWVCEQFGVLAQHARNTAVHARVGVWLARLPVLHVVIISL